jgi:curli biogenesis system outer membrane secretion channel CsgG
MKVRPAAGFATADMRIFRDCALKFEQAWRPSAVLHVGILLLLFALDGPAAIPLDAVSPPQSSSPSAPPAANSNPKRIAVLNFDDSAVTNSVQALFGFPVDVGKGMAGPLVRELGKSSNYRVTDPKTVDKVFVEQKFSKNARTDRESAVKIGKLLGVDGVVIGTVTQFGGSSRRLGDENWIPHTRRATVEVEARLVDVATDEIVAVAMGSGEASTKGTSLLAGWHGSGDDVDFAGGDFQQTAVGQAVNAVVSQMAGELDADSRRLVGKAGDKHSAR